MPQTQATSRDRISELPQDAKQKILSCLMTKEAAATMFLSKSWKDVWLTLPSLDLEFVSLRLSIDQVLGAIDDILTRRSNCADKLSQRLLIRIPQVLLLDRSHDSTSRLLNKWIDLIVNDFRVKDFVFWIDSVSNAQVSRINDLYEFPTSIVTSEKQGIKSFKLRGCALKTSLTTRWSTLRHLFLWCFSIDQQVLDSLTCNCPLIDELSIYRCTGDFDTIKASHLKGLVSFWIDAVRPLKRIDIHAPNLRKFVCGYHFHEGDEEDEGYFDEEIANCVIDSLSHSKGLTSLGIVNDEGLSDEWLDRNLGQFTKLEYLNLDNCNGVKHLKFTSICIRSIDLDTCNNLRDVTIDYAPQLSYLCYSGTPIPCFKLIDTPSLKRVHLSMYRSRNWYVDEQAEYERLVRFLSGFSHLEEVELEDASMIVAIPDDVRKISNPPLVGVKTLIARLFDYDDEESERPDYKSSVENLLWVAPRPDSLSILWTRVDFDASGLITDHFEDHKIIQFKYEEDEDMVDKCDNCKHLPVRCWRHGQVTIESKGNRHDQHDAILTVLAAIFNGQVK